MFIVGGFMLVSAVLMVLLARSNRSAVTDGATCRHRRQRREETR